MIIIQSYLNGELSDKIQVNEINSKIKKYKQEKLKKLKKFVDEINMLNKSMFLEAKLLFKSGNI